MTEHIELMTVQETANYLKIKVTTLYQWKYDGKIPYIKINGHLCFDKNEINKFIKQFSM